MQINEIQAKKVLTIPCKFSQLGFNMLITRLSGCYQNDPSEQMLKQCTDEINVFLTKYKIIMKNDYEVMMNL